MQERDAFYEKLRNQLNETTQFPSDYMYKFIVPSNANQAQEIGAIFDNKGAIINTKKSKTGKYVSVSIVLKVKNAEEVIRYYREAEKVEGVISL